MESQRLTPDRTGLEDLHPDQQRSATMKLNKKIAAMLREMFHRPEFAGEKLIVADRGFSTILTASTSVARRCLQLLEEEGAPAFTPTPEETPKRSPQRITGKKRKEAS